MLSPQDVQMDCQKALQVFKVIMRISYDCVNAIMERFKVNVNHALQTLVAWKKLHGLESIVEADATFAKKSSEVLFEQHPDIGRKNSGNQPRDAFKNSLTRSIVTLEGGVGSVSSI